MKRPRKRVSLIGVAGEAESVLRDVFIDQPKAWIAQARERMKDLPKTNSDLGLRFAEEGKWFDAAFRFRVTLMLDANYPRAAYNLGCCYLRLGKPAQAREALLKAQKLTPGNSDVIFMLAAVDPKALAPGQRPTRMPMNLVTGYFNSVANGYDISEAQGNYQAGKVVAEFVDGALTNPAPNVLDLGCGSGIAARPWRAAAASIHGIDVTPAMLTLAERATHADKKLYDTLLLADVSDLANASAANTIHLALLVNVAQFIGDLVPVLQGISKALAPGGLAVITTEPYPAGGEFGLNPSTSRFGHAPEYTKKVVSAVGLTLVKEATVELYQGVPAQAYLVRKES